METSYELMKILSIEDAKQFADGKVPIIITGVTGQDGSFMADYLLNLYNIFEGNIQIFGGARRLSVSNHDNIKHLEHNPRFHLINFDLTDVHSISQIISQIKPSYFINFAAQSFVKSSWDFPVQTSDTNTTGVIHILEAIRLHCPKCRFYNAGSSEEFGDVVFIPQNESHPLRPRSPYGASKASTRHWVKVYRESYGLYAVQGWLFNHEGTRRGEEFVTRKITKGVAQIVKEIADGKPITSIELGNLDAKRDWSDAEDCVKAVWKMLTQNISGPDGIKEYIVSSGETHSVREFVEEAFKVAGIHGKWWKLPSEGLQKERYVRIAENQYITPGNVDNHALVKISPSLFRPAEVDVLLGDSTKIQNELGWKPETDFKTLVRKMVERDLKK